MQLSSRNEVYVKNNSEKNKQKQFSNGMHLII